MEKVHLTEADFERIVHKSDVASMLKLIDRDSDICEMIWSVFRESDERARRQIMWVFSSMNDLDEVISPTIIHEMIELLGEGNHNGIDRGISKVLMNVSIPEKDKGMLFDKCVNLLLSPDVEVAIKANCMSIAFNTGKDYPDLLEELKEIIRDQMNHNTIAFCARSKQVLKDISKIGKMKNEHD